jgi:hypothetical protein
LGRFVEHLVCNPKPKGLRTLFKSNLIPCKKTQKQTNNQGHNPQMELYPKTMKNGENLGFGNFGEKVEKMGK